MVRASRALAGALAIAAIAAATRGAIAGCEYYTNCGACVADTSCGWCGHDPHSQGGYGDVNAGDHVSGLVSGVPTLVGGEGRYSASGAVVTGGEHAIHAAVSRRDEIGGEVLRHRDPGCA